MWEGRERLFFSGCDACLGTCCGICPEDPSSYKITSSHLKVRIVTPTYLPNSFSIVSFEHMTKYHDNIECFYLNAPLIWYSNAGTHHNDTRRYY